MNKVIFDNEGYHLGDIFINYKSGEFFILAKQEGGFAAISLKDGWPWNNSTKLEDAIDGLTFVKTGATITIL